MSLVLGASLAGVDQAFKPVIASRHTVAGLLGRVRLGLTCALLVLISGCTTTPNFKMDAGYANLAKTRQDYTGRFSLSYLKDGQQQREQGGFEWMVVQGVAPRNAVLSSVKEPINSLSQTAMKLVLLAPLGNTIAVIALDPLAMASQRASISTPARSEYAADLDTLMQRTLGWRLPLLALLPWLNKGEPEQAPNGWQMSVASRFDTGMPRQITAINQALNLNVRLVFEP